jgi:hypothetical protein
MGLPISSCSTLLVKVHRDCGFSVQSASSAIGWCTVLACELLLCSVQLFLFSAVGLYYDSVYSTLYGCMIRVYISIHSVVCLMSGPWPLPKRVLQRVRSSASSFNYQYPLVSLRSPVAAFVFLSLTSLPLPFLQLRVLEGSTDARCDQSR